MGSHARQINRQPFTEEWQTSLVRCTPCGPFCKAVFCPCITFGETAQRLHDPTVPTSCANKDCCDFIWVIVAFGGCCLPVRYQRAQIRKRYRIKGSDTSDWLVGCCFCCCPCALLQHEQEVKARVAAEQAARAAAAVNKEGYQPQKPMRAKVKGGNKQPVGGAGARPQLKKEDAGYRVQEPMAMKLDAARERVTGGGEGSQGKEERRRTM